MFPGNASLAIDYSEWESIHVAGGLIWSQWTNDEYALAHSCPASFLLLPRSAGVPIYFGVVRFRQHHGDFCGAVPMNGMAFGMPAFKTENEARCFVLNLVHETLIGGNV